MREIKKTRKEAGIKQESTLTEKNIQINLIYQSIYSQKLGWKFFIL